ncbi:MAG: S8 family serine peptidase [Reyranellaceae bacterium]
MRTAILALAIALAGSAALADQTQDAALALRALRAACPAVESGPLAAALERDMEGAPQSHAIDLGLGLTGWRLSATLKEGGTLQVSRLASGPTLQRVVVELGRPAAAGMPARPVLEARAERDCQRIDARALVYDGQGRIEAVALLDESLQPTGRTLPFDPPVPAGHDPGGVGVALLDTGVNYLQPAIAERLARGPDGQALGYDFEDDDPRPFDLNLVLSPFHPGRHGTLVAHALLREAAPLRLIPLRYPRSQPQKLADAVELAARAGAKLLLVGLGSRRAVDWQGFADALRRHPDMLAIVSAGRDGEDIDDRAYYPPALALPNMLTVGAADGFGQPVRSNWGLRRVDVLAPAERLVVRNFDDVEEAAAGAEFAAARVAALATRLLAAEPGLTAAQMKARLLAMARLSDHGGPPRSAYGVIPEEAFER